VLSADAENSRASLEAWPCTWSTPLMDTMTSLCAGHRGTETASVDAGV
jgi:hypothetical protein